MTTKNIPDNHIHLWLIDVSHNCKPINLFSSLNKSEQERANSFRSPELGQKWAFTRQALREILAKYLAKPAEKIEFTTDEYGKPRLKSDKTEKQVFFNLSHSGNKAIVAITSLCSIGVDVEKQKEMAEFDNITQRFFSESEHSALTLLPYSQRLAAFFRVWTRKEALIKANGLGMSMPLEKFNVPIAAFENWHEVDIVNSCVKNGHYCLYDVIINGEYDAAVCLYSDNLKIEEKPHVLYYDYQANHFG